MDGKNRATAPLDPRDEQVLHDFLDSALEGGMMGGYREPGLPFYMVNRAMLRYLGYEDQEEFVRDIGGLIKNCIHPGDRDRVEAEVARQLAGGGAYQCNYRMRKKDGSHIWVKDRGKVIETGDGRQAVISVCLDITDLILSRQEAEQNRQALHSIINSIAGGVAIFQVLPGKLHPVYQSDGAVALTGLSPEECGQTPPVCNALERIYATDRGRVMRAVEEGMRTGAEIDVTYRVPLEGDAPLWVQLHGHRGTGRAGGPLLLAVLQNVSLQTQLYTRILNSSDRLVLVSDLSSCELLFANAAACRFAGDDACDYYGRPCYEYLRHLDAPCPGCERALLERTGSCEGEQELCGRSFLVRSQLLHWMGREVRVEFFEDITDAKRAHEAVRQSEKRLSAAVRHSQMLYWEYDLPRHRIFLGEKVRGELGLPPGPLEQFPAAQLAAGLIHPDDEAVYLQKLAALEEGAPEAELDARLRNPHTGAYEWKRIRYTTISWDGPKPLLAVATAQDIGPYKELEHHFATVLNQHGLFSWEYILADRSFVRNASSADFLGYEQPRIPNFPEALARSGVVHPDDVPLSNDVFRRVHAGEPLVKCELRMKAKGENRPYRWYRVFYTAIRQEGDESVRAVGTCLDITDEKLREQQYREELLFQQDAAGDLVATCCVNLTRPEVESVSLGGEPLSPEVFRHLVDFRQRIALFVDSSTLTDEQNEELSPTGLLRRFYSGERRFSAEYQAQIKTGNYSSMRTDVRMVTRPGTAEVLAFFYNQDITRERALEFVSQRIMSQNFQLIACIDAAHGDYVAFLSGESGVRRTARCKDFEADLRQFCENLVAPEDRARVSAAMSLRQAALALQAAPNHVVDCTLLENGQRRNCQLTYSYLDPERRMLIMTRSDTTEYVRAEQQRNARLAQALAEAERANEAKTAFLARMSHDIRTPMNAIMGMTALAKDQAANPAAVRDYLEKVELSSRFLLGLLNDILDVSRLESNALRLNPEPYSSREFQAQVNTLILPLCRQKNITFVFTLPPPPLPVLLVDHLRFEQIFFNLLTNAVKYTPEGGRVEFTVQLLEQTGGSQRFRFEVRDNGIGISPEFQRQMFEPFSQERAQADIQGRGAGLGLSIVKSLVDLMEGRIEVESAPGRGTTFRIELEAPLAGEEPGPARLPAPGEATDLTGLRVLLCEDHPLNTEIAKALLEKQGATVCCAANGREGLERFAASAPGEFGAVLMDIRMPVMDGLEAAAAIRALNRPDAKTVPIVAMTANAYAEDREKSRRAGMDAHLAKPVDPTTLFATLYRLSRR